MTRKQWYFNLVVSSAANDLSCDRADTLVVERQNAIGRHWAAKRIARLLNRRIRAVRADSLAAPRIAQGRLNSGKGATDCLIRLD